MLPEDEHLERNGSTVDDGTANAGSNDGRGGRGSKRSRDAADEHVAATAPRKRVTRAAVQARAALGSAGASPAPQQGLSGEAEQAAASPEGTQQAEPLGEALPAPVVPLLPPVRPDPLNAAAIQALNSHLNAAEQNQHLQSIRLDDAVMEVASRRGLLARFTVHALSFSSGVPDLVVEAPEFATVEFLKRRIFRAKLQRGEVSMHASPSRTQSCFLCNNN